MTEKFRQLDLLLNSIEENCSPEEYEQASLLFMFDCPDLVEHQLPDVARKSLSIAKSFAQRRLEIASLDQAIVALIRKWFSAYL
jgi:hypothetical protein